MKELKITKGVWDYSEVMNFSDTLVSYIKAGNLEIAQTRGDWHERSEEEIEANAQLIAEAGTVSNECGKSPRELVEENEKLNFSLGVEEVCCEHLREQNAELLEALEDAEKELTYSLRNQGAVAMGDFDRVEEIIDNNRLIVKMRELIKKSKS